MAYENLYTTVAATLCVLFAVSAACLEFAKYRERTVRSISERAAVPAVELSTTPLLVGLAIVALAFVFFTLNHVDRSLTRVAVLADTSCQGVYFEGPKEAVSGETVEVGLTNVPPACKDFAGSSGLLVNGVDKKVTFLLAPSGTQPPSYTFKAWLPAVSSGASNLRVVVPERTPLLVQANVAVGTPTRPDLFQQRHTASTPIVEGTPKKMIGVNKVAECKVELYYPNMVSAGSVFPVDARNASASCGPLTSASILETNGTTIMPIGSFFDGGGQYVRWYSKVETSTSLTIEFSGASTESGAEIPILVKDRQSF